MEDLGSKMRETEGDRNLFAGLEEVQYKDDEVFGDLPRHPVTPNQALKN